MNKTILVTGILIISLFISAGILNSNFQNANMLKLNPINCGFLKIKSFDDPELVLTRTVQKDQKYKNVLTLQNENKILNEDYETFLIRPNPDNVNLVGLVWSGDNEGQYLSLVAIEGTQELVLVDENESDKYNKWWIMGSVNDAMTLENSNNNLKNKWVCGNQLSEQFSDSCLWTMDF